ncbi:MAG: hypothetical protein M5U13_06460 [Thermoanaerobaculia bacterium]|nr:hypothetical protein [Thermoanaerobaculia bacterium]
MPGGSEEGPHRALLHDLSGVHDVGPLAALGDDRQVVRDEEDAEAEPDAERREEVEDLRLDRHV